MLRAHDVAGVRAAEERAAITRGWDDLMQQAATALADVLLEDLDPRRTPVFLIGPGNNGGDALFAAARLCQRGRRVNLCLLDPARAHEAGLLAARTAGAGEVDRPDGHEIVVDGVLGIGARPGLQGRAAAWAAWQARERPFTVAVDVPSGIGVDDGTTSGPHLVADRTVTFGSYKPGLLVGPAADAAGVVTLVPIGLDEHLPRPVLEAVTADDAVLLEAAVPRGDTHKYSRGVLGVRAGSPGYPGAAHLAVAGGQAGLAGYLRYVGHAEVAHQVVLRAPEVVAGGGRVQAWVVGPGGGEDTGVHVREALDDDVPVVLDATALQHLPEKLSPRAVLTPHAGELATLLEVEREAVEADPWGHARSASWQWDATVLLKGRRTIVVPPEGPSRVNLSGTAWLGTAGSGDVLAGFVGSLLAAGLAPVDAASLGAFLHGAAAVRANPGGPITASGVASALPVAVADFVGGRLTGERDW